MTRTDRTFAGSAVLAGFLVAATGLAWACTTDAGIYARPSSGPAGSVITLEGQAFYPDGLVEIYWDTAGGHLLATARGPSFEVQVTIPTDAGEGTHYIAAYGYHSEEEERVVGKAETVVTVVAPSSRPQRDSKGGDGKTGSPQDAASGTAGKGSAGDRSPGSSVTGATSSGSTAEAPGAATSSTGKAARPSRQKRGGSTPVQAPPGIRGSKPVDGRQGAAAGLQEAPSRWDRETPVVASPQRQAMIWGMMLLGSALVVMLAGFAVAAVRRSRAGAHTE